MISAILAIAAYLAALHFGAVAWVVPLRNASASSLAADAAYKEKVNFKRALVLGYVACLLHLVNITPLLAAPSGLNFTLVNVASLISLMMSLLVTIALPRWKTVWFPASVIYVLGIICTAIANFVEGSVIKQLAENAGLLFHLSMALFSYSLFFLALLYAVQLKWLDSTLKNKRLILSPNLPALMTVERHFFTMTLLAQSLLTIALVTGMVYLHDFFADEHIHKAIFSGLAWLIYTILLLGQWKLRWRGNRVLIYSISGMILLTFSYFGSRM